MGVTHLFDKIVEVYKKKNPIIAGLQRQNGLHVTTFSFASYTSMVFAYLNCLQTVSICTASNASGHSISHFLFR